MTVPRDWRITYSFTNVGGFSNVLEVRGVCPYCHLATTFQIRSCLSDQAPGNHTNVYLVLQCNCVECRRTIYVESMVSNQPGNKWSNNNDPFFVYPSQSIDPIHISIPGEVAEDWLEAQRSIQGGNPKAAAVMLRRVLYGVLIDKGCKLHPLQDGLQELITRQRLPAVFDDWLPAIRDDGHDGAHPDRALKVSSENVSETMEYTSELLRFLYIEPYEFQQRKSRNATPAPTAV